MGDAVADGRGRGEGEVDDAERDVQALGGLVRDELADARDLEGGALDQLGDLADVGVGHFGKRRAHDARAGDADVHGAVGFARAVECAGHKGVILHRVAENDELRRADAVAVGRALGRLADDPAHEGDGVHIDARARRADVHGGTDVLRLGQRLRNAADQRQIAGREALLHQRGIAANEVHAHGLRGALERVRKKHGVALGAGRREHRDRRDAQALVNDRNAVFLFDARADGNVVLRDAADLVINFVAGGMDIRVDAIEQGNADRDRADVEMLLLDHADGFENVVRVEHGRPPRCGAWR